MCRRISIRGCLSVRPSPVIFKRVRTRRILCRVSVLVLLCLVYFSRKHHEEMFLLLHSSFSLLVQVKRFTNDVLRILKSQACKQISLGEFPATYSKIFGRNFEITDYGMCNMIDALSELPDGESQWTGDGPTSRLPF